MKEPDGKDAPLKLQRLEINGIDFAWPTYARVARIRLKQPVGEVDRAADGTINVQKLFTPGPKPGAAASPAPPAEGAREAGADRDRQAGAAGRSRRWSSSSRRS